MQLRSLLLLVDGFARVLREVDRALSDGVSADAALGAPLDNIDGACREIEHELAQLGRAFQGIGDLDADSAFGQPARLAPALLSLERAAHTLAERYMHQSRESRNAAVSTLHARLAEVVRDNLVTLAEGLARLIDGAATLALQTAASGCAGEVELALRFESPASAAELAAWSPRRAAYDRAATQRALHDAERCRATLHMLPAEPASRPLPAEPPPKASRCPAGLLGFLLGWVLAGGIFGGED